RMTTLLDLRYQQHYEAEVGHPGGASNCSGRTGENVVVVLPVGTVIFDDHTGEMLADLVTAGQQFVAARGGWGGRGNSHFATSTNRTPTNFETGTEGEERSLKLELKLLADVGLVGFPNAGKSTFISTISAARPKIADYPFTTLTPNLGVVDLGDFKTFVIADIPGLIEGAHAGAGLGDRFLRHIERTKLLLHLVDVSSVSGRDAVADYLTVNHELRSYNPELARRPQFVVATKLDALDEPERLEALRRQAAIDGLPFYEISSVTNRGTKELVAAIAVRLDELTEASRQAAVIELAL